MMTEDCLINKEQRFLKFVDIAPKRNHPVALYAAPPTAASFLSSLPLSPRPTTLSQLKLDTLPHFVIPFSHCHPEPAEGSFLRHRRRNNVSLRERILRYARG